MHKFFAKKIVDDTVSFFDKDVNHIIKVLRIKLNEQIIVNFNYQRYLCVISSLNPLRATIINKIEVENKDFKLNVFLSSIKVPSLELAIKKAVELDVDNFYIFNSNYSQMNIDHNLNRYRKIIDECSKQSSRTSIMNIEIVDDNVLNDKLDINDINLIADFSQEKNNIKDIINNKLKSIGIIIGPEGGFNDDDLVKLKRKNTYIINLTKTILRSETALIYVLSIVNFLMKGF